MAYGGEFKQLPMPVKAGESLATNEYFAVALDDGKVANNGSEACGILQNKPASGEPMSIGYQGVMKFKAGGAVAAWARMTVATSGYFTTAGSGYYTVGRALAAVTSGSIGTGVFDFTNAQYANTSDFIG